MNGCHVIQFISRRSFLKACSVGLAVFAFESMPIVNAFAYNSINTENVWELYTPDEIFNVGNPKLDTSPN